MAISPTSFFDLQAQMQSDTRLRNQSDTQLSNSFMGLSSVIMRLSRELSQMTSFVSTGQKQENKILSDMMRESEISSLMKKPDLEGAFGGESGGISSGETGKSSGGLSSLLAGGAAAGGLAAVLASVLGGGGEPGAQPGSVPGGSLGTDKLVSLAQSAGFKGEDAAIMAAIAMAESGGKSGELNDNPKTGDLSYGLWQINMIKKPGYDLGAERRQQFGIKSNEELFDPATNANAAKIVKERQGFSAWSVYKSGKYRDFLPAAQESLKKSQSQPQSTSKPSSTSTPSTSQVSASSSASSQIAAAPSDKSDASQSDKYDGGPTKDLIKVSGSQIAAATKETPVTEAPPDTSQGMIASYPQMPSPVGSGAPTRGSAQSTGSPDSGNPLSMIASLSMGIQLG